MRLKASRLERRWICGFFFVLCTLPSSVAQQAPGAVTSEAPPAFASRQVEVTPYVWGTQFNSDDQFGDTPFNAELGLGRILRSLTGLAELEVVPRYKNLFVFGDGIYTSLDISPKTATRAAIPGLDHINIQAGLASIAGGFSVGPVRLNRGGSRPVYVSLQPFGGAAYTSVGVTGRSSTPATVARVSTQWWMPVVGARIDAQSGNYLARLEGDFSNFQNRRNAEQVLASVGYQTHRRKYGMPSINIGYRYLYEKNADLPSTVIRLKPQGPIMFFVFHL